MKQPFFTIVIANYNYGRYLHTAINSVLEQTCQDFELIVIDGGSTDNSIDVLNKNATRISYWVSEKDKGQSNAFNKGFSHAKGEFLTWLNADDILLPGALKATKAKIEATGADWATGNLVRFDMSTRKLIEVNWGPYILPHCLQGNGWPVAVYGPTTFWRRSVFEKLGPIDEKCYFSMDTEYWMRLLMNGYRHVRVNEFCWAFGMHNNSKTAEFGNHQLARLTRKKQYDELARIGKKHGYHTSRVKQIIFRLWRLLDGSFVHERMMQHRWLGCSIDKFLDRLETLK